jgi:transcriptional antiterminator RfaH
LIPSIVFIKIEAHNRNLAFQSSGVARYLYWLEKPAVVNDLEIETMREWLTKGYLNPKIEHLKPGDRVSIANGPFKGQKAILRGATNNSMQLLLVEVGIKITITKPKEC